MATDYFPRLKTIPLFASLKEAELAYTRAILGQVGYRAGAIIIRQGEPGDTLYIIDTGQVCVRRHRDESGAEVVVSLLGPGQFFGEAALLYGEPRNATVLATVDTTLFYIRKDDFYLMAARLPTVKKRLEAARHCRSGLGRFDWQLHDEVVISVAFRHIIPLILESAGGLIFWLGITVGIVALSFLRVPRLWQLLPWGQRVLRISPLILYGLTLIWYFVNWTNDYLVVTNKRVAHVERHGWDKTRHEIPIRAVQNVVPSHKGLLNAVLKLGDITVETIGGQVKFTHVKGAEYLSERILDQVLVEERVDAEHFDFSRYRQVYASLTRYLDSVEAARLYKVLNAFLSYEKLSALPAAVAVVSELASESSTIRPTVLTALVRLREIGADVATYQAATSRVNRLALLAHAVGALDDLDKYVMDRVIPPDRAILRRIIRQWRRLVSEAGGEVGRAEKVGPVVNPYVAGNPVTGDLFVGREDVLRRLEELWSGTGQKPSVVLYGHRRMGKSSILHNLGARFGARTVIVDFNMQRVGLVVSTGELLYNLALALYDAQQTLGVSETPRVLDEPDEIRFTAHNPYTAFDRFLKRLDRVRADHRFIVTVDEFELIEEMIAEGQLEPRLLDFWRGLIQTYPWFVVAFAGLHTLQEMTRDYWHPLFGSVLAISVSFLSREAAWRLVTQPTPDFPLDYDTDAVERIITRTHGQPYLVQLIGHGLVTRFNRQTFEEGVERERRFTLADVVAVIVAPEFYRDGDAYFTGVWQQAETSEPPGQTAVLRALAQSEAGMSADEVARQAGLAPEDVGHALETLKRHDVVMEEDNRWQFTVELMRLWVAQR